MKLLSVNNDAKTVKSLTHGILTGILYLAPANQSGYNVCQFSSAGCRAACLYFAGHGQRKTVQEARIRKTKMFFEDRATFLADLRKDIALLEQQAARKGLKPAVRLNGTSDLPWERIDRSLFADFSHIQFYDYTKIPGRWALPPNYHLTFSQSEENEEACRKEWAYGRNITVVHDGRMEGPLAQPSWLDHKVPALDGDKHDARFLDVGPALVLLKVKGFKGREDDSGFIQRKED